jgi:hypothetical protein
VAGGDELPFGATGVQAAALDLVIAPQAPSRRSSAPRADQWTVVSVPDDWTTVF